MNYFSKDTFKWEFKKKLNMRFIIMNENNKVTFNYRDLSLALIAQQYVYLNLLFYLFL